MHSPQASTDTAAEGQGLQAVCCWVSTRQAWPACTPRVRCRVHIRALGLSMPGRASAHGGDPLKSCVLLTGAGAAGPRCADSCSMPLITSESGRLERPEETAQPHSSMSLQTCCSCNLFGAAQSTGTTSGQKRLQGSQLHEVSICALHRCCCASQWSGMLPAATGETLLHNTARSHEATTTVSHKCTTLGCPVHAQLGSGLPTIRDAQHVKQHAGAQLKEVAALQTCLPCSTPTAITVLNPKQMLLTGTPLPPPHAVHPGHAVRPQL